MTLRLYDYAASGNCYKVRLLLAQLGLLYERVPIDIFAGDTLTDEYAAINRLRSTPVLEYEPGKYLPESNAILVYLAQGTPFLPGDREGLGQVTRWLIYEQTDVIPAIAGYRFRIQTGRLSPDDPRARHRWETGVEVLELLDDHLTGRDFLVDRYSVADISVYGYVHVADEAGHDLGDYPSVAAWLARVQAQPGHLNDLEPYPPNSHLGKSRSTYDAPGA
jgi:glutathione S-transferase